MKIYYPLFCYHVLLHSHHKKLGEFYVLMQPSLQNLQFFGVIQNAPEIKDIINLIDTKKNETFIIDFHVYLIPFESLHLYEYLQ